MQTWSVFGHNHIKNLLDRQLGSQKFSHAYLLCGPAGVGKRTLAMEFAKKLLGAEVLGSHPDFQVLDQAGEITMESILEFLQRLPLKPFVAQKKVAIINNAQNLNLTSANALLKNLEEPSDSTIIILIAEGAVLPTIASRCQLLNFNSFSNEQLKEFAAAANIKAEDQHINLSAGKPARLKRLAEDNGYFAREQDSLNKFKELEKASTATRLASISEFGNKETEELEQIFSSWLELSAREKPSAKVLAALLRALAGLKANLNKKLILQGLFLNL